MIGYLDIETSFAGDVTVVGLMRPGRGLVQLVGEAVTAQGIGELLDGLDTLCTFHGEGFDLPKLSGVCGVDLLARYRSLDLGLECRRRRLRGGLKGAEARLGIHRSSGLTGYDALLLWERWERGDRAALETLLEYNREDVWNLWVLERRLCGDLEVFGAPTGTVVGV